MRPILPGPPRPGPTRRQEAAFLPLDDGNDAFLPPGGGYFASDCPVERRFSQAVTTRSAMPFSAALPQERGS
ncbi:hypothetical protein Acsp07_07800 [Actinomycetospora sp. NBRC 106378]|nr:hypothetical protein Acsp07_07800 [Actinomycetospora sp. NBRC 106378]